MNAYKRSKNLQELIAPSKLKVGDTEKETDSAESETDDEYWEPEGEDSININNKQREQTYVEKLLINAPKLSKEKLKIGRLG